MSGAPPDRDVRDDLVGHYQAYARSRGADPSTRDLEALAISDLITTDRVEAEARPRPAAKPAAAPSSVEMSPAERLAAGKGFQFQKREAPAIAAPRAPAKPLPAVVGEYYTALIKRMREMCAQAPSLTPRSHSLADREYLYPALAKGVVQEHTDYTFGRRRYRDLNHRDRQRAFWRAIADLADKSTGVLGPWWVK